MRFKGYLVICISVILAACSSRASNAIVDNQAGRGAVTNQPLANAGLSSNNFIAIYNVQWAMNPQGWSGSVAVGPDKNLWVDGYNTIGRVTPAGTITTFSAITTGYFITRGPNNSLWFDTRGRAGVGRITPHGVVSYIPFFPNGGYAIGATKGPDGNLWFVDGNGYIGFLTSTGSVTEYPAFGLASGDLVTGPDQNVWFSSGGQYIVGMITTAGVITMIPIPSQCQPGTGGNGIVSGPDGNLWMIGDCFTGQNQAYNALFKISPGGAVTVYPGPGQPPGFNALTAIGVGPDRQIWLSDGTQHGLVEFNIAKQKFSKEALFPNAPYGSFGLTVGPSGDLWFTVDGANPQDNYIGVYEENVTEVGIRLNGEMSIVDPNYGFELGYAAGTGTTTQTIGLHPGESVQFTNLDTISHSAAFLGDATANGAPWPGSFNGSTVQSPAGSAIGTTGWATGSLSAGQASPIYETGLPGFYMIGCQYHYNTNEMRTVIVVH